MEVGAVTAAPDTIEGALEIVRSGHDSWSVIISPHRTHSQSRRLIYQARAALEESEVAMHVTPLSPLGVTVLTEMAQPLLRALPANRILPALAALESQIRCLAVTSSVTNMADPKVSMWLHARSWIPGGTYLAERGACARSFSRKQPEKALDSFPAAAEGNIAIVAESDDKKRSRSERINSALDTFLGLLRPKDTVHRPNVDPQWWGSPYAAQIVIAPTNLGEALKRAAEAESTQNDVPSLALGASPLRTLTAGAKLDIGDAETQEATA